MVTYGPRDSRCCYEANAPQQLHWAVIADDPRHVVEELTTAFKSCVPPEARIDAWADVKAVIERFERCHAVHPDDVKPIMSDPRLWEMRIELETYDLILRVYETEIRELPGKIVALRAHRKAIAGSRRDIRDAQDAEIKVAGDRWDAGRDQFWGAP